MTQATSVTMVDPDLDVIRRRDGRVELLDVGEFEAHQVELGHPEQLAGHAERRATQVLAAVRAAKEPFAGTAAGGWVARPIR